MKQAGDILTLEGVAESNARVASYMRNIDNSPWMGRTDLRKIENKAGSKDADKKAPYLFSLDVKLRKPEDAQNEKSIADSGASDAAPAAASGAAPSTGATPTSTAAPVSPAAAPAPTPAATGTEKGEKK
jgi:type IV pilus assembly protein PilN